MVVFHVSTFILQLHFHFGKVPVSRYLCRNIAVVFSFQYDKIVTYHFKSPEDTNETFKTETV